MIDPEDQEKSIKTEHNDPNYETIYENYEQYEENSQDDEYEHLDEHNTTASDSEEIHEESPQDDDEEEEVEHDMETTIDQVEEYNELEEDAEDYRICFVKSEDTATDDFMEFEQEVAMEEVVPPATKRKYTKQSKDSLRPYKCWIDKCGTTFAHRNTMKKHMKQLHEISSTKSTCLMCGENFGCYADFLKHVKAHTRKSQCDVCKLTFVDDEKMLKHKARFHKNQDLSGRNFECQVG